MEDPKIFLKKMEEIGWKIQKYFQIIKVLKIFNIVTFVKYF